MMTGISDVIDLFSLYVLLSHFRPSDVTPEKYVFYASSCPLANACIKYYGKTKVKFPS